MLGAIVLLAGSATSAVTAIAARWIPTTPRNLMIGGLLACAAMDLGGSFIAAFLIQLCR